MSFEMAATTLIAAFVIIAVCILYSCAKQIIDDENEEKTREESE